jgi:hypothetical protein
MPLGGDEAHTDVVTSRSGDVAGGDALAPLPPGGTCLDLVVSCLDPSLPGDTTSVKRH